MIPPIGVGLYGHNGHQLDLCGDRYPNARLVAVARFDQKPLPDGWQADPDIRSYATLAELLADRRVQLVSLCSPRRVDQARDAIACLRAGRAVYAEKPAALTEDELDRITATAATTGMPFREMAGTAFQPPYATVRKLVASGRIGTVVQVMVQKSYPYHSGRPLDDAVDGGLIGSAGIHAIRLIEHVAGESIVTVAGSRARLGGRELGASGRFTTAATLNFTLASGGVATAALNYLNPQGTGVWGNDELRIFGTAGLVAVSAGGARTRLVVGADDLGPIDDDPGVPREPHRDLYFDAYLNYLVTGAAMPLSTRDELHPTRVAIEATEITRKACP
ncbi:putative dehydrogenase [Kribbella rubisoli]|uniref:Dehydrogenase n=1 Tax=Kribbella rubisoli TaxID=3075929 RepID=A0A4Q7WNR3_9ACTN|nr:Gfo/Idh/MocA family oxidoreductase [Kribbella rubisoli]RZU11378.1 putative dehydrogenase [Kribbella rubisoli]